MTAAQVAAFAVTVDTVAPTVRPRPPASLADLAQRRRRARLACASRSPRPARPAGPLQIAVARRGTIRHASAAPAAPSRSRGAATDDGGRARRRRPVHGTILGVDRRRRQPGAALVHGRPSTPRARVIAAARRRRVVLARRRRRRSTRRALSWTAQRARDRHRAAPQGRHASSGRGRSTNVAALGGDLERPDTRAARVGDGRYELRGRRSRTPAATGAWSARTLVLDRTARLPRAGRAPSIRRTATRSSRPRPSPGGSTRDAKTTLRLYDASGRARPDRLDAAQPSARAPAAGRGTGARATASFAPQGRYVATLTVTSSAGHGSCSRGRCGRARSRVTPSAHDREARPDAEGRRSDDRAAAVEAARHVHASPAGPPSR